ncbi:FHA domain-containing protein [Pusillimonas sp. MFBS29]|uniref:FHA domain-containing protein n=1 Tax=Pusillimonas sp. MFBS29 TaxID=2886690 RepID=UPI001D116551|nr:FHA domain-containing protein [Pusillimonas sp. MFBS29]MCC2596543.1 FHA domain-containing protein [Pusillimonas sp. MFBS29]
MRIIATHIPTARTSSFEFKEPGGTIGRCPGNHLLLDEDTRVGRVQAVMRAKGNEWSIMNVSSRSDMALNGQALLMLKELPITAGDTLTVGDYLLKAADAIVAESSLPVAATPDPVMEQEAPAAAEENREVEEAQDIFKELLDGPGVLPVGQPVEAGDLHPFELASQAPRNHPDPIQTLHKADHYTPAYSGETLNTEPEQHDSHIFSDPVPSTLRANDALASQRKNLIGDALAHGHASAPRHEKL